MKDKNKGCLLALFIVFILIVGLVIVNSKNKKNFEDDKLRMSFIRNIRFKGKVVKSNIISRYGKQYNIICIYLDYTNTSNFYIFNDLCALKIKDNVATMSNGVFMEGDIPKYVEINVRGDLMETVYFTNGKVDKFEMGFGSGGVLESDLSICN